MPGTTEGNCPMYISSHSADVILSDIRPIKLKAEGLRSVNVLLDEFLYNILSTSRSLSTDKLRAGLLRVLPTNLGKEALLEAEVELRAYWDRTAPPATVSPSEDDIKTFHLQWAFELLRLKCEAYCTLNESDDDPGAESRLHDKMKQAGAVFPPKTSLIAPAALYLTAVLESMCEHVLSNVGRVASRDSSRTTATIQDLFVALCEDDSIYGLFKSMKVYEQIELLSKSPKPRRSKSFTRSDKASFSRTSSPQQDLLSSGKEPSLISSRSRVSSELSPTSTMTGNATTTSVGRSSSDKGRMKLFGRTSNDRDLESQGHKRSESLLIDDATAFSELDKPGIPDTTLLQEFDDLMRSDSTLKVSLTPDRLKTMEHYKQEKDLRGNRRPAPLSFGQSETSPVSVSSRANGRLPSLRHVDSIIEDEEEAFKSSPASSRNRHAGITPSSYHTHASPPTSSNRVPLGSATNHTVAVRPARTSSRSAITQPSSPPVPSSPATQPQDVVVPKSLDEASFPRRNRKVQRRRESLDLDDVMAGSDDEAAGSVPEVPAKSPTTPRRKAQYPVSSKTRDLMDFLDEGPPPEVPPVSKAGKELIDFLAEGPPNATESAVSLDTTKKGSGRLQRMVSKLTMGTSGKSRSTGGSDDLSRSYSRPPVTPIRTTIPSKSSSGNLSSLANRPIPPRPRPISPPSSPTGSIEEKNVFSPPSRKTSVTRKIMPTWEQAPPDTQSTAAVPAVPSKADGTENGYASEKPFSRQTNGHAKTDMNGELLKNGVPGALKPSTTVAAADKVPANGSAAELSPSSKRLSPKNNPAAIQVNSTRNLPPKIIPSASSPHLSAADAIDMRRLFSKATNVDECRLIFDMFLAKSGLPLEPTDYDIPYPSPSLTDTPPTQRTEADDSLEHSIVEFFLDGDLVQEETFPQLHGSQEAKAEETVSSTDALPPNNNGSAIVQETETHIPVAEIAT